jgi:hypothetical protein
VAAPIKNKHDFARTMRAVSIRPPARRPSLLAFFLFDERQSHQVMLEFARRQFDWLDRLAGSSHMILFFFLPDREPAALAGSQEQILVADGEQTVANPSLQVAQRFGLGPSELPGVIFFTELDIERPGPHDGVFWPLTPDLFEGDGREAEDELSHLFGLVHAARATATEPGRLLEALRLQVDAELFDERKRPVLEALRTGAVKLVTFPVALVEATSVAFAQGLGQGLGGRVAGG